MHGDAWTGKSSEMRDYSQFVGKGQESRLPPDSSPQIVRGQTQRVVFGWIWIQRVVEGREGIKIYRKNISTGSGFRLSPPLAPLAALHSECPASEEAYADDDEAESGEREYALVERGYAGADERGYAALEGAEGEHAKEGELDAEEDARTTTRSTSTRSAGVGYAAHWAEVGVERVAGVGTSEGVGTGTERVASTGAGRVTHTSAAVSRFPPLPFPRRTGFGPRVGAAKDRKDGEKDGTRGVGEYRRAKNALDGERAWMEESEADQRERTAGVGLCAESRSSDDGDVHSKAEGEGEPHPKDVAEDGNESERGESTKKRADEPEGDREEDPLEGDDDAGEDGESGTFS
ncbi:hypothetical protein C8R44DRAFT_744513 [Mycena epipterygia]|nr:hypothetical protein C8R44DRAFT_744513 [Mycena epipterygia]